ncbi:type II secretion system F family protein [Vibrio marisflavi]|uniref:Type II secretion system protein GspF domain-containing protein n=1 Tax=Vibrio marisflavi CECT 7928 TaxID=634439 RepID=A0ABM9A0Y9_9VIBR|nr:type II secretion system F family protein [Vibrio marisflavi]CAH0537053.1 hypothetical protein VMF7928_00889 [Vibrio marisflavi CECT 7928]
MYWFILMIGGLSVIFLLKGNKPKHTYLDKTRFNDIDPSAVNESQVVDLNALSTKSLSDKLLSELKTAYLQLGKFASLKLMAVIVICFAAAMYINRTFVLGGPKQLVAIFCAITVLSVLYGISWLKKRAYKQFSESFPEALNILGSAISTGESIVHAISYVGKNLDGDVGKEFKLMGERLLIGEKPESVFRKSCARFPYSAFLFFAIVLNANIQRGGQLKEVISRLNRMIFNERAMEKKKMSLTSEARMSVKIVASVPFIFLFLYQFISPPNFNYVLHNPKGHYLLYYLIGSNLIGFSIAAWLMRD